MKTYEVEYNGKRYEVQAESASAAASAFDTPKPEEQQAPEAPKSGFQFDAGTTAKGLVGLGETALTGASSTLGTIAGGIAGGVNALAGGDNPAGVVDKVRDLATIHAHTEWGKANEEKLGKIGELVSPALQYIDDGINFIAEHPPAGPLAGAKMLARAVTGDKAKSTATLATLLKTGLYGAPNIAGVPGTQLEGMMGMSLGKRAAEQAKAGALLRRNAVASGKAAEDLGITLSNEQIGPTSAEAARRMSPSEVKAADMQEVQKAVQAEQIRAKTERDAKFTKARESDGKVDIVPMQASAVNAQRILQARGIDVSEMSLLKKRLGQIMDMDRVLPGTPQEVAKVRTPFAMKKANLRNIEIMDRRLTEDLRGAKPHEFTSEQSALLEVRSQLRRAVDEEFNAGAITGDPNATALWKEAKDAANQYRKNFKSDKVIRDLVAKEASPEQVYQWIIGASANGMKKQAVQTIERLKQVLGPDHPAIKTTKAAVLRDVFEPVLGDRPNYYRTAQNIDRLLKNNPSAVEALGINTAELRTIQKAMNVAQFSTANELKFTSKLFTQFVARELFGSSLAKKAVKVNLAAKIMNYAFDTGALTPKKIKQLLAGQDYKSPIVPFKNPSYKEIMLYGAAADASNNDLEWKK